MGGVTYDFVRKTDDGGVALAITRNGGLEVLTAERILVATKGRRLSQGAFPRPGTFRSRPSRTPSSGAVVIDDRMGASKAGVYAAGDVTGKGPVRLHGGLWRKARGRGRTEWRRPALRQLPARSCPQLPSSTDPRVASVEVPEAQARAAGHAVRTSVLSLDTRAARARGPRHSGSDQACRGWGDWQASWGGHSFSGRSRQHRSRRRLQSAVGCRSTIWQK